MKQADIIGVWEEDEKLCREFCDKYQIPAFTSLQQLIDSDAEGVIVCTSTASHADIIEKLAAAKKHIFTEKMLATTEDDCIRIAEAVKSNGVNFAICFPNIYYSGVRTVKQVMESGELDKIISVFVIVPAGSVMTHGRHGSITRLKAEAGLCSITEPMECILYIGCGEFRKATIRYLP